MNNIKWITILWLKHQPGFLYLLLIGDLIYMEVNWLAQNISVCRKPHHGKGALYSICNLPLKDSQSNVLGKIWQWNIFWKDWNHNFCKCKQLHTLVYINIQAFTVSWGLAYCLWVFWWEKKSSKIFGMLKIWKAYSNIVFHFDVVYPCAY